MKRILLCIFALWATPSWGQLTLGKVIGVNAPVCKSKASAIAIANGDRDGGIDGAVAVFKRVKDCAILEFQAKLIRTVYKAKTERGVTVSVIEVKIEMVDGTWGTFYILTDHAVNGEFEV